MSDWKNTAALSAATASITSRAAPKNHSRHNGSVIPTSDTSGSEVTAAAVRPLADALDLQRQFVTDASHELRTPLAVVSTRAQMVQRHLSPQLDPAHRHEVDQLVEDTRAMGEVVADLLLSAQLEHTPIPADQVDLVAVAVEVVKSLTTYAAEHSVRLVVHPEPPAEVTVLGVRVQGGVRSNGRGSACCDVARAETPGRSRDRRAGRSKIARRSDHEVGDRRARVRVNEKQFHCDTWRR